MPYLLPAPLLVVCSPFRAGFSRYFMESPNEPIPVVQIIEKVMVRANSQDYAELVAYFGVEILEMCCVHIEKETLPLVSRLDEIRVNIQIAADAGDPFTYLLDDDE
ncbi:hypothetical protein A9Q81_23400 [Gammaproteobacteria bacterium 42_54_T18]|nr:hypothetical protein A9Q81_23400 [Gammaproteobacteria bacterium 42_54_T18]